ncbi:MAG: hypothetical protein MZW92_75860 [Comamonadaceae bacterium]|nr:hypothetical protein [Comamonadaceae bacterium]
MGQTGGDQDRRRQDPGGHALRPDGAGRRRGPVPRRRTRSCRFRLAEPIAISTDPSKSADEIAEIIDRAEARWAARRSAYPEAPDAYEALRTVLAWNTIYDPGNDRVISPVSRAWSAGGWVLFEWDTYFAAYMLSLDCKELAYANAIAITGEITDTGIRPEQLPAGNKEPGPVAAAGGRFRRQGDLQEISGHLVSWTRSSTNC